MTEEHTLTIDELAAASQVPSRTIRSYQSRNALMAPEIRGRVVPFTGVRCERFPDEASFAAAVAALALAGSGRVAT